MNERRTWPANRVPEEHERIETACEACGLEWWIHQRMAGHRLRCECGAWIDVPGERRSGGELLVRSEPPAAVVQPADYSRAPASHEPQHEVPTSVPMPENALRHAPLTTRRRWTNRGLLELTAVAAAFLLPPMLLQALVDDRAFLVFVPLTDLIAGLLVVLVGLTASHYAFGALRRARPRYFLEGALVGLAVAGLAIAWAQFVTSASGVEGDDFLSALRDRLGLGWTLVLVGAFPAVFEEIAFRGLLQGRLASLHGRNGGILLSGIAFALAHGFSTGLPFHIFGGFYLGWLRARSESLYPGMLVHGLYNSTLVLALTGSPACF